VLLAATCLLSGPGAYASGHPDAGPNQVQSFLVHSDTQYRWYDDGRNPDPKSTLEAQSKAIAAWLARQPAGTPVFLNGDVTAYGHGDEWTAMRADLGDLRIPDRYWGLGNHDYQNNIRLPDGSGCFNNGCARDSITHLISAARTWSLDSFDFKVTDQGLFKLHRGSLAYSKTIGDITFIQLHNHYAYAVDFVSSSGLQTYDYKISSSLPWLEKELKRAKQAGKFVVIHQHRPPTILGSGPQMEAALKTFAKLVKDYRVLAVFHGHTHKIGKRAAIGETPVLDSGASFRKTFMTAELDLGKDALTVYEAKSNAVAAVPLQTIPLTRVFAPDVQVGKDARGEPSVFFFFGDTRRDRKVGWVTLQLAGESTSREGKPGAGFSQLKPMTDYEYTLTAFATKGGEPLATFKGRFNSGSRNAPPTNLCVDDINGSDNSLRLRWDRPATFPPGQLSFVEGVHGGRVVRFRGPNSSNQQSTVETIRWLDHGVSSPTEFDYAVYYWSPSEGHTPRAVLRGADLFVSGCPGR